MLCSEALIEAIEARRPSRRRGRGQRRSAPWSGLPDVCRRLGIPLRHHDASSDVGSTTCGHLPKIVARRVRWRLPPPPPSPAVLALRDHSAATPEFSPGFQALFRGHGAVPARRDAPRTNRRPVCEWSSREPVFMVPVVRCVRASWDTSPAEGGHRIGLRRGPILSPSQ